MELKVKQLEEAQSQLKLKSILPSPISSPGVENVHFCDNASSRNSSSRRSLPSTPSTPSPNNSASGCSDLGAHHKLHDNGAGGNANVGTLQDLAFQLEEARKTVALRDQEIMLLKNKMMGKSHSSSSSPEIGAKGFKSPSQIAEQSKTSSISFAASPKVSDLLFFAFSACGGMRTLLTFPWP